MRRFITILFLPLLALSCYKANEDSSSTDSKKDPSDNPTTMLVETRDATNLTENSAVIFGYANITPDMENVSIGVVVSADENPSTENGKEFLSTELDSNNQYSVKATNLSSNTQYFYKSFVKYGGIYHFGEIKSFSTLPIKVSINNSSVTNLSYNRVTLNAMISVDSSNELPQSAWFIISEGKQNKESLLTLGITMGATIDSNGTVSREVLSLKANTEYSYIACAKVYDTEAYSEVKSFVTAVHVIQVSISDITATGATFYAGGKSLESPSEGVTVHFYYSSNYDSCSDLVSSGVRVEGRYDEKGFNSVLKNLCNDTKYYCVASLTDGNEVIYSDVSSFVTAKGTTIDWVPLSELTKVVTYDERGNIYYQILPKVYVSKVRFNPKLTPRTDVYIGVDFISDDNPDFFAFYMTYQGYLNLTYDGKTDRRIQDTKQFEVDFSNLQSNVFIKGYQYNAKDDAVEVLVID